MNKVIHSGMGRAGKWARTLLAAFCMSGACVAAAHAAPADNYPERPVKLVVGFAPGGSDISARLVADRLSKLWGQPVVVDNRPGAAGNIGAANVANATPDGYTILLLVNSYTINTTVYNNLTWDLLRDFKAIGRYAVSPMAVVVNSKLPVKTLAEFIDYAKAKPGELNYGSAGVGTAPHLAVEVFNERTGIDMTHVAYKGSAPSVTALAADEVQVAFGAMSAFDGLVKAGTLRPLAVTTAERFSQLPDVPTIVESNVGVTDFDLNIWYGFLAPAGTPDAIVQKLSDDLGTVMKDPGLQEELRQRGMEPAYLDHKATTKQLEQDVEFWAQIAKRLNLSLN
ncbi:tripartite tricarboxylate transporter substrate binding protein [Alcaligenaceae bacterium]|nr:tripartite tricarboxylate transporter substrate binding protein [Alcaligenaceae bacterium]